VSARTEAGSDALAALERELGGLCTRHAPQALEGAALEATLRPRSAEECAAALGALQRARLGAHVTGGGSRLAAANAPCAARVRLDTTALREECELDLDEGVARFAAGEPLAAIAARLEGSIWQLPLDPPGAASTLGGALASAALGPRFGHPRDVVLGLGFALASGALAKCGGRVVKNVTGYDLAKLFVGSNGSLVVITSAWLRLRPRPERVDTLVAPAPADATLALAAARAPTARAAALLDAALAPELCSPLGGARAFVLELAGDDAAVASDRAAFAAKLGAADAPSGAIDRVREAQGGGEVCFRVAALPSELAGLRGALGAAGASVLELPARGLAYARFEADPRAFRAQLAAVSAAAHQAHAAWRLEAAPLALRAGAEVLGAADEAAALQRALKRAYDPAGILNPGRGFGER
jgi:glycolate oxidase FAD binding subunit